jgi:hypothetical protein
MESKAETYSLPVPRVFGERKMFSSDRRPPTATFLKFRIAFRAAGGQAVLL